MLQRFNGLGTVVREEFCFYETKRLYKVYRNLSKWKETIWQHTFIYNENSIIIILDQKYMLLMVATISIVLISQWCICNCVLHLYNLLSYNSYRNKDNIRCSLIFCWWGEHKRGWVLTRCQIRDKSHFLSVECCFFLTYKT